MVLMDDIRLVAFDVDGVIRDASRLFYECHMKAAQAVGLQEDLSSSFGVKDIWHFKGLGRFNNKRESLSAIYVMAKAGRLRDIRELIYRNDAEKEISEVIASCSAYVVSGDIDRMVDAYVGEATSNYAHRLVSLYPGAAKAIRRLKDSGMRIAIVSNSDIMTIERDLRDLLPVFDHVVSSKDVKELKPSGEGLRLVAGASGIEPKRMLYVGDTVVDIKAANDAGCMPVSVLSGMGLRQHLERERPARIFDGIADVVEWVLGRKT